MIAQRTRVKTPPAPTATPDRDLKLELAQQIVKLILGNPVMASSFQYARIVELISQYTEAIGAKS